MKNSWEKVLTSTPLNKTAAVVANGKGEHWEPSFVGNEPTKFRQEFPPEVRVPIPGSVDLRGQRYGRLKVIGLHMTVKSSWVVRCDCGAYEARKARILNDPAKARNHMCSHCEYLEELKLGDKPGLIERQKLRAAKHAAKEGTPA